MALETWQIVALAAGGYFLWRRYQEDNAGSAPALGGGGGGYLMAGGGDGGGVSPGGGLTGYVRARNVLDGKRTVGAAMAGDAPLGQTQPKPPAATPGFGSPPPLAPLVKNAIAPTLKATGLAGFRPRALPPPPPPPTPAVRRKPSMLAVAGAANRAAGR